MLGNRTLVVLLFGLACNGCVHVPGIPAGLVQLVINELKSPPRSEQPTRPHTAPDTAPDAGSYHSQNPAQHSRSYYEHDTDLCIGTGMRCVADPVDVASGSFRIEMPLGKLTGNMPFSLNWTFVSHDSSQGPLGVGTSLSTDYFIYQVEQGVYELHAPGRLHFVFRQLLTGTEFANGTDPEVAGVRLKLLAPEKSLASTLSWPGGMQFEFDESGSLARIADRYGNYIAVDRNGKGYPTRVARNEGRAIFLQYDRNHRLITATDAPDRSWHFEYDRHGQLVNIIDPSGAETKYTWTTFIYTGTRFMRDALESGLEGLKQWKNMGAVFAAERAAAENRIREKYGPKNLPLIKSVQDARGNIKVTNEYDEEGRVILQTYADGRILKFRYSASRGDDGYTELLTANGNVWRWDYKWNINVPDHPSNFGYFIERFTDALKRTTTFERKGKTNFVASVTDSLGRRVALDYDEHRKLVRISQSAAFGKLAIWKFAYDLEWGDLTSVVFNGQSYSTSFDAATKTFTSSSPSGRQASTVIDSQGRPSTEQIAGLLPSVYSYDALGRMTKATAGGNGADARSTNYNYDAQGYLESVVDPLGQKTSFKYDVLGRLTQKALPDGRLISYGYDAAGNLTRVTPQGKPAHLFSYSNVNLLNSHSLNSHSAPREETANSRVLYAYNFEGQLTRTIRPDGLNVDIGYDRAGRRNDVTIARGRIRYDYEPVTGNLATIAAPGGIDLAYNYDDQRLISETWNGPVRGTVKRTYNSDFRVKATSINDTGTISFEYDDDGLLTRVGDMIIASNSENGLRLSTTLGGITDQRTYNGFAEPVAYLALYSGSPFYDVRFDRDSLGRMKAKTETINGTKTTLAYSYDLAGRLVEVKKNGIVASSYSYDSNGNRLSFITSRGRVTGTYDDQDRLTSYGGVAYAYSANGELKSRSAGAETTTYQYDELGNLMAVTLPTGGQVTYLVDGRNRRIAKHVNGITVQKFLYLDQLKPIAELNADNDIISHFVYATRSNVPDYLIKRGVIYRVITDHLGSPRLVVDVGSGKILQRMDYDEFGRVLQDTNPGFQPFGFAGGLYDPDTKLIRFGARDYDPETGRWTAKDPIRFLAGDTSLYAYVGNDPINRLDVSGLQFSEIVSPYMVLTAEISSLRRIYDKAISDTKKMWPNDADRNSGVGDAYRHCVASCEAMQDYGENLSSFLGDANELIGDFFRNQEVGEHDMDVSNNACGRMFGRKAVGAGDCSNSCLSNLSGLTTYKPGTSPKFWDLIFRLSLIPHFLGAQ